MNLRYNGPLFKIWGNVITTEEAYNARMDKELKPTRNELSVKGVSDGPFGSIYFNYSMIEGSKYDPKLNYALYFVVEMGDNKPAFNFNGASMEVTILKEQNNLETRLYAPENVYVNGKLSNNEIFDLHYFRHKLRTDINNPYMLIEFSANSLDVKWFVSTSEFDNNIIEELPEKETKYKNGKESMIFKVPFEKVANNSLYLIVYNENKTSTNKINPKLANYIFKYMNGENKDSLFKFELPDSKVEHKIENKNHELSFLVPFEANEQEAITYYVKGIYNKSMLKGEIINSIAISESNGTYLQAYNATPDSNKKITLKLENIEEELSCIKVLVKGTSNAINLYALYDVVSVGKVINCSNLGYHIDGKNDTKPSDKNDTKPSGKNDTKNDTKPSGKNDTKNDTKPSGKNDTKNDTKPSGKNETKNDTKPSGKDKSTNPETKPGSTNETKKKEGEDNKLLLWIILGVGGGLALIIIILLICVLVFNHRNKNLLDTVNQVSFANDRNGGGNLLSDDDKNILK
jgi:hypothetical protein